MCWIRLASVIGEAVPLSPRPERLLVEKLEQSGGSAGIRAAWILSGLRAVKHCAPAVSRRVREQAEAFLAATVDGPAYLWPRIASALRKQFPDTGVETVIGRYVWNARHLDDGWATACACHLRWNGPSVSVLRRAMSYIEHAAVRGNGWASLWYEVRRHQTAPTVRTRLLKVARSTLRSYRIGPAWGFVWLVVLNQCTDSEYFDQASRWVSQQRRYRRIWALIWLKTSPKTDIPECADNVRKWLHVVDPRMDVWPMVWRGLMRVCGDNTDLTIGTEWLTNVKTNEAAVCRWPVVWRIVWERTKAPKWLRCGRRLVQGPGQKWHEWGGRVVDDVGCRRS